MRSLQGSFGRLKLPLLTADHDYRVQVIEIAVQLHQVRCRSVQINQTHTVYQSVESEWDLLSQSFHHHLFSSINGAAESAAIIMAGCNLYVI